MSKTLSEVISERFKTADSAQAEVVTRVERWQAAVEKLFERIDGWLKESSGPDAAVRVELEDAPAYEDRAGDYTIKKMLVQIGRSKVRFLPKGTWIIGAEGRVDVEGPAATARLIWEGDERWTVVLDPVSPRDTKLLDSGSLAEALDIVLG